MPASPSLPAPLVLSDPATFVEQALRRHESLLVGYAFTLSRDADHSREIACETFTQLCSQNPGSFRSRGHGDPLRTWLLSTCRKLAIPVKKVESSAPPQDIRWTKIAGAGRTSKPNLMARFEELPVNQREAIFLKCYHELSYDEIAKITGLSRGNVGFLVAKGLQRIRRNALIHS